MSKIEKFQIWLNEDLSEAEILPKKPAKYKVGENVMLTGREFSVETAMGKPKKSWPKGGVIATITKVESKGGKWFYTMKMIHGAFNVYYSTRGSGTTVTGKNVTAYQGELTQEGVEDFMKIVRKADYKIGEEVFFTSKTPQGEIARTSKIVEIDPKTTLEKGVPCYLIQGTWDAVPETDIHTEVEMDEAKEEILAEEIAKVTGTEIVKTNSSNIEFDVKSFDMKEAVSGLMFFKSEKDLAKFTKELREFIDSKLDPKLQSCMNDGKLSDIKYASNASWRGGRIDKKNLREAARNLKIDVEDLFDKKRGTITGKNYGI
jgi:hypothetical protein